jgi:uncharacterized protein (DUF1499 family)
MERRRKLWVAVGLIGVLVPIAGLAMLSSSSRQPTTLGVIGGRLAACPNSPNCVSSQATDETQHVRPFPLDDGSLAGETDGDSSRRAIEELASIVSALPRTKVVHQTDDYLHVQFTSVFFRFVDDVEFYVDPHAGVIHVRSASRVGHSDLGANRRRVEAIRTALASMNASTPIDTARKNHQSET